MNGIYEWHCTWKHITRFIKTLFCENRIQGKQFDNPEVSQVSLLYSATLNAIAFQFTFNHNCRYFTVRYPIFVTQTSPVIHGS